MRPLGCLRLALFPALILIGVAVVQADDKADAAATAMLGSARKAYAEKNYPAAAKAYREFLTKLAGRPEAPAARFGLALCLLNLPDPDYGAAQEELQTLTANKAMSEHAFVLYNLGLARRGQGIKALALVTIQPREADALAAAAAQQFTEAGKQFALAADAFAERAKRAVEPEATSDREWALRARCDQAQMLLQTRHPKEAQSLLTPLAKDPHLLRSRHRSLVYYHDGWARFLLKDYLGAGRSLGMVAPFTDVEFGSHARYLLARVHHLQDERAEAVAHYDAVVNGYDYQKRGAVELLKRPDRTNSIERARLTALANQMPPEHVARARFYLGVLQFEAGRFGEALGNFAVCARQSPPSPLSVEAQLYAGFCQVQAKQFPEAVKTLQPLIDREPRLADQSLFWLGKAQAGAADPANGKTAPGALDQALATLQKAADKAQERSATDPEAKLRRGAILLERADTLQLAERYKEAAVAYEQILTSQAVPEREEVVLQRLAAALNLAGDFDASDKACARFVQAYPRSLFLSAVHFRQAENALARYQSGRKNAAAPARSPEIDRLADEAIKRYQVVVERYPDFPYAGLARFQPGIIAYRNGELEKARELLEAIPAPDRSGDLAIVPFVLADCLIRLAPIKADDALTAGQAQEQLQAAIERLDAFISSDAKGPLAANSLLRAGYCYQRLAGLMAQPEEKTKALTNARIAYKRIYAEFPNDPVLPYAVFEEGKCFIQMNNAQRAVTNLTRFAGDPLRSSPIAPLGLLQLATVLRAQNKAAEAANVLAQCRQQHEAALRNDPARAGWVPMLVYHHGVAVKEAGKLAEARAIFESVIQQFPASPQAAEAALRQAQCLLEEGLPKIEKDRQRLQTRDLKPEDVAAALKTLDDNLKTVREASQFLDRQEAQLKQKSPESEARARMLYEAAWANRLLAESEIASARAQSLAGAKTVTLGDVPLTKIAVQPAEQKARTAYQTLITAFPDLPLGVVARVELGEMLAERGENDAAMQKFVEALDKEPAQELTDRVRVRMGLTVAVKGDAKAAKAQFDSVVKRNPKAPNTRWVEVAKQLTRTLAEGKLAPRPDAPTLSPLAAQFPVPPVPDRAGLDDPTGAVSLATVLTGTIPERKGSAPFLRLSVPDPYEFHLPIAHQSGNLEEAFPVPTVRPPAN